ncbi:MAG TPA: hypothetical protein EYH08_05130 [Pyrodictium sp.]|nr:hypothetical protein [Aquificaceae bacterium]HIP65886.1 hypothetical protein [Pyrodictium sp.]
MDNEVESFTLASKAYKGLLEKLRGELAREVENAPASAREAVASLKVIRLKKPDEIWAVLGRHNDYIVIPSTYCSCPHFTIHVVGMSWHKPCYHLVAVELAKRSNRFRDLSEKLTRDELYEIVYEILYEGRSRLLRRLVYGG